jgi:2-keto-4-pentenoate hydratase
MPRTRPLLTADAIDRAARTLLEARRAGALLPGLPEDCRPRDLADAYAVQDRLFALLDEPAAGWFLGCTNPEIQRQLGLPGPYRARLLAPTVHDGPARLDPARFPTITLEVEFAFRLARDLPPRDAPYTETEVADAVAAVHPSIEVVTSHFEDWTRQPVWSLIADNGTDGALVLGPGREDWRGRLDLAAVRATLEVNGEAVRTGLGSAVLGHPLAALIWLTNDLARTGNGLKAGQVCNTGTCTAMMPAGPGDRAVARFEGLGAAEVRF